MLPNYQARSPFVLKHTTSNACGDLENYGYYSPLYEYSQPQRFHLTPYFICIESHETSTVVNILCWSE